MKLTMELTNEQYGIILSALEEYFRLRMGQADIVAQEFSDDTYPVRENFKDEDSFLLAHERWLIKRDAIEAVMRAACELNYGRYSSSSSDRCRNASDLWSVMRYSRYKDDPNVPGWDRRRAEPIQLGTIPLPIVRYEQ